MLEINAVPDPPRVVATLADCVVGGERVSVRVSAFIRAGADTSVTGIGAGGDGAAGIGRAAGCGVGGVAGLAVLGTAKEPDGRGLSRCLRRVVLEHGGVDGVVGGGGGGGEEEGRGEEGLKEMHF